MNIKACCSFLGTVLLVFSTAALTGDTYELISSDEYARTLDTSDDDELFERAGDPLGPEIEIRQPGEGEEFNAPVDIDIAFVPADGASIDLDSLKITYGSLGINVTDRVLENAEVSPDGIVSNGAMLPAGKHKLTVYISDNHGRTGKRRFRFRIKE